MNSENYWQVVTFNLWHPCLGCATVGCRAPTYPSQIKAGCVCAQCIGILNHAELSATSFIKKVTVLLFGFVFFLISLSCISDSDSLSLCERTHVSYNPQHFDKRLFLGQLSWWSHLYSKLLLRWVRTYFVSSQISEGFRRALSYYYIRLYQNFPEIQ